LVSIIHANNEIGTIQDLKKITSICKKNDVLFHTDAVQSFGKIPIDVKDMNIDCLSVSSHKIYGPKGVGALYIKDKNKIAPLITGGGQENNLRSGTENLPGIVGFSTAAYLLNQELLENSKRLRKLQITLMDRLLKCNNIIFTGAGLVKIKENIPVEKFLHRIPGHVSFCVQNTEGENLVLQADLKGIAISSGSACSTKDIEKPILEPSHILKAIKVPQDYIKGSLRITLGRENTEEDVICIAETIQTIINSLCKNKVSMPLQ
jgi:cysteine desulfurase